MRASENRGSQEEEEGMIDISTVWPRAESIHRPLFFARELTRYCPLKFLRDENKSCSDTNNAESEMIRRDWRDDYSCRYHDTTECTVYFAHGAACDNNIHWIREFRRVFPRGRCNFCSAMTQEERTFPGMARPVIRGSSET